MKVGPYFDYHSVFSEMIKHLIKKNEIPEIDVPIQDGKDLQHFWNQLSKKTIESKSSIVFLKDGFYSNQWNSEKRENGRKEIIERLNTKNDIDLILAMGTESAFDLSNNRHHTSTLVITASDLITAGLLKDENDRPFKHVNMTVNPFVYSDQIKLFYWTVEFKRLGIIFENDKNRSFLFWN